MQAPRVTGFCPCPRPRAATHERLSVPLRWWVQATMLLATLWLAFVVAMPAWAAWAATGGLLLVMFGLLRLARQRPGRGPRRGAVRRTAHISVDLLGPAEPLDAEETRRVHGVDADARAFLLTRPYLKRAVRVRARPGRPDAVLVALHPPPRRLAAALGPPVRRTPGSD